jgi:hypothetical protein
VLILRDLMLADAEKRREDGRYECKWHWLTPGAHGASWKAEWGSALSVGCAALAKGGNYSRRVRAPISQFTPTRPPEVPGNGKFPGSRMESGFNGMTSRLSGGNGRGRSA